MIAETLIIDLGAAVAKVVLKIWIGDPDVAGASADFSEILATRIGTVLAQRRTARAFERISEEVAQLLESNLAAEYRDLAENEKNAALLTVQETLTHTSLTSDVLLRTDLDPLRLEKLYRKRKPNATKQALLGDAAVAFYNRLLQEVCEYIVAIALALPQFGARATVEVLQRETELLDLVRTVLSNLPRQSVAFAPDSDDFETRYRRAVVRKLDRLELFGVTVSEFSRRYRLDVAYITLTATATPSARAQLRSAVASPPLTSSGLTGAPETASATAGGITDDLYVRVDAALADTARILIRGEAGSGKTTLLQYLAVRAGSQTFEEPLTELNECVPFFIQLRRYSRDELPKPEHFIDAVAPQLAGVMPSGWIHAHLDSGRALLLIDGVDELPQHRRKDVKHWISDIRQSFPHARYVVTSRPPAVADDWLADEDFEASELQPMVLTDISAFIDHWHEAAAADINEDNELAELDRLQQRLQGAVREIPPIRALATSPLLCAMLCALNRDRKAQLPKDRLELYRISLETLVDRRDIEREVTSEPGMDLGYPSKELLLQDLAYWLLRNSWADVDKDAAINRFRAKLNSMPHAPDTGTQVFAHLLERSGLLREPVVGRIDFVHRTFQEYLAAKQAVDEDDIGVLLQHATEDAWREVIILAAGHARLKQRVKLISGLLSRGRREGDRRHLLHLLAVACLETSPELPADLTAELHTCLEELVPPSTMTEARALASAGELAVPLLAEFRRKNAPIVAACIRTLALIGGDSALDVLSRYGSDGRVMVSRELVRAWRSFDPERYAETVLANAPFPKGLTLEDFDQLHGLRHLRRLSVLVIDGLRNPHRSMPADLACAVQRKDSLRVLSLRHIQSTVNVAALESLSQLRALELTRCSDIDDLAWLRGLPHLEWLLVSGCPRISDVGDLEGVALEQAFFTQLPQVTAMDAVANPKLTHLHARNCGPTTLHNLRRADKLEELICEGTTVHGNLESLGTGSSLTHLTLDSLPDATSLDALAGHSNLSVLRVAHAPELHDISAIATFKNLSQLALDDCGSVDLDSLAGLGSLTGLSLRGADLADTGILQRLTNLRTLSLSDCTQLRDLSGLVSLKRLRRLELMNCKGVTDLSPVAEVTQLTYVDLEGCVQLSDVSALFELKGLRVVDLQRCDPDIDVEALLERRVNVLGPPRTRLIRLRSRQRGLEMSAERPRLRR